MRTGRALTMNLSRIFDAAQAVEGRLEDGEVMGLGLIYGRPGLGKTFAIKAYHSAQQREGHARTAVVRLLPICSESFLLRSLLDGIGHYGEKLRKYEMLDLLTSDLKRRPCVLLIDEIDIIIGHHTLMGIIKYIHDETRSAIIMIGEERVGKEIVKHESFCSRLNESAVVHVTDITADDVKKVVAVRCEIPVEEEVCEAMYKETGGCDMRRITNRIAKIERFSRTNSIKRFGLQEWKRMASRRIPRETKPLMHAVRELGNA